MRLPFLKVILFLFLSVGTAYADSPDKIVKDCLSALKVGDVDLALEKATEIKTWRFLQGGRFISGGADCLSGVYEEEFVYSLIFNEYVSAEVEKKARDEASNRREKQQRKLKEELAKQAAKEKEQRIIREQRLKELQLELEIAKQHVEDAERERQRRLAELNRKALGACNKLYSKRPNEALLNQVCYSLFTLSGLPDID